jgi:hypothetical protein
MRYLLLVLAALLLGLPVLSQTGGVTGKSSGVALQQQTPGNDQNGNFHVNGIGIVDKGLTCYGPQYSINGNTQSLFYGTGQIYDIGADISAFSTYLGNGTQLQYGGNSMNYNTVVGDTTTVAGSGNVAIGAGAIVGDPTNPGNNNRGTVVGYGSWGYNPGSIILGCGSADQGQALWNASGSIVIGCSSKAVIASNHGSVWGSNVVIGHYYQVNDATNIIQIDSSPYLGGSTVTRTSANNNTIYLGNANHTKVVLAGVDQTPGVNTSWVPTFSNLTVVNGTGGATYSGGYIQAGNVINWWARIMVTGTCTTAATLGSTQITNLPFTNAHPCACFALTTTFQGIGYVAGVNANMPTWSARNENVNINGVILLQ